ncbi:DNA-binding MarR family transcriptional regulator [Paraburkholderia sp. GAS199]|uniref:MarR family winged helix-turn-helix transcriptional regulator n=1 Tax=Paraburkholderia sp. GAS199 TaxID=3035126 RepID=UPI003D22AB0C
MDTLQCNCSSLRSATRSLSLAYDEVLRPSGLKTTQYSILSRIASLGEMTLSELAEILAMDRTTMGRNLQPLERDGLVQISIGEDRRARLVSLTARGQQAYRLAKPLWEKIQQRFEKKFGKKESKALRDLMGSIISLGRELSEENAEQV